MVDMIDPLKLMIGDWVWSLHYNNYYQITPESYFMCNSSGIITPRRIEGLDLEPISLTEDILNKYGMYNSGDNYYFTGSIRYRILHYKEIENALNFHPRSYSYLHEFQQLLRSLGEYELANKNVFITLT